MEEEPAPPPLTDPTATLRLQAQIERLRMEQDLRKGSMAAMGAALIGAFLWGLITVFTGRQHSYMALGMGILVGYANRSFGKGVDLVFGCVGAVSALIGCLLGNLFSTYGLFSRNFRFGLMESFDWLGVGGGIHLMQEYHTTLHLLFYGLALFSGFKLSFVRPQEA